MQQTMSEGEIMIIEHEGKEYVLASQDREDESTYQDSACYKCAFRLERCDNRKTETICMEQDGISGFRLNHYWVEKE